MKDKHGNYCVRVQKGTPLLVKGPSGNELLRLFYIPGDKNRKPTVMIEGDKQCNLIHQS